MLILIYTKSFFHWRGYDIRLCEKVTSKIIYQKSDFKNHGAPCPMPHALCPIQCENQSESETSTFRALELYNITTHNALHSAFIGDVISYPALFRVYISRLMLQALQAACVVRHFSTFNVTFMNFTT